MPQKLTTEVFIERIYAKYNGEYTVLGDYQTNHTPILMRHELCGNEWGSTAPYDLLKPKPNSCPKCASNRSWKLTSSEFQDKLDHLYGEKEFIAIDDYTNNRTKLTIQHNRCKAELLVKPMQIMAGKYTCQNCKEVSVSKVAYNTKLVLDELNLSYESEKTFTWLKHELPMFIDFFLPDFNIAIEADGEQHYIAKRGGDTEFLTTMLRDKKKTKLCRQHGITVVRVPSYLALHQLRPFLTKMLFELDVLEYDDEDIA